MAAATGGSRPAEPEERKPMFRDSSLVASDVMTRGLATVHADTRLRDAAKTMVEHHVSGLPVVDDDGKVVGVVSEADLIRSDDVADKRHDWWLHVLADGYQLAPEFLYSINESERPVSAVMHSEVISVAPGATLSEVSDFMTKHNIKRVLVLDEGKLAGIVSRTDLVRVLSKR
jgi:CBS domain-containing protein